MKETSVAIDLKKQTLYWKRKKGILAIKLSNHSCIVPPLLGVTTETQTNKKQVPLASHCLFGFSVENSHETEVKRFFFSFRHKVKVVYFAGLNHFHCMCPQIPSAFPVLVF